MQPARYFADKEGGQRFAPHGFLGKLFAFGVCVTRVQFPNVTEITGSKPYQDRRADHYKGHNGQGSRQPLRHRQCSFHGNGASDSLGLHSGPASAGAFSAVPWEERSILSKQTSSAAILLSSVSCPFRYAACSRE